MGLDPDIARPCSCPASLKENKELWQKSDVAKALNTVWIDVLLYKLTLLNVLSYIVRKSHHTSGVGLSKRPSRQPRHLVEACGLGWLRVD
jgi:hypothetical protein